MNTVRIPGHDHQRTSLDIDGFCDLCTWCDDCDDAVAIEDCPHWRSA